MRSGPDDLDVQILDILGKDARQSARSIAREIGVSPGLVLERVRQMEGAGLIRGYRVEVNPQSIGLQITASLAIQLSPGIDVEPLMDQLIAIEGVEVVNWTTGKSLMLAAVRCQDTRELREIVKKVRKLEGVETVEVLVSLASRRRAGGQFAFVWTNSAHK
ncbi:MAG: hypothetical protein BGN87_17860 [Rhizobiales bacterium 65-79]|jgi:Lrp/AsnC family leucine-responsive transcriptional regulator|nr:Lrp/AsnC family transcriptional regulator [Hyphomicrobiales bacterium]OJU06818.1 MAG: hypothetical protein BGN87_17860 [Rhizobiales bacterium 65-79]